MLEKLAVTCDRLLSQQQVACCHSHCAFPARGKDVLVYSTTKQDSEPVQLTGHHGEVSALAFGQRRRPILLCSASADYIIVWDIEQCQRKTRKGEVAAGTVIGTLLGKVVHLSFCASDERVAACSGATVNVLSSKTHQVISTLTSHLGPLTSAEFCPWNADVLVTISEDRTFKVWNLKTEAVCYHSFVLSAFPLLSLLFLEDNRHFITGSTDGQVWCFSLSNDFKCHLVSKMDLQKMEKRYEAQQGIPSHQDEESEQTAEDKVEMSKPILKMASSCSLTHTMGERRTDSSWLCVGSLDGLYVVDLATSELRRVMHLKNYPNVSVTMAGSWSIAPGRDGTLMFLVSSLLTPYVALLECSTCDLESISTRDESLSVFPSSSPLAQSVLNAEFQKKTSNHPKKKGHPTV